MYTWLRCNSREAHTGNCPHRHIAHTSYFCTLFESCYMWFSHSNMPGGQQQPQKHYGITSAISLAPPREVDHQYTKKLCDAMKPFGVFEDEEELNHRWADIETSESVCTVIDVLTGLAFCLYRHKQQHALCLVFFIYTVFSQRDVIA